MAMSPSKMDSFAPRMMQSPWNILGSGKDKWCLKQELWWIYHQQNRTKKITHQTVDLPPVNSHRHGKAALVLVESALRLVDDCLPEGNFPLLAASKNIHYIYQRLHSCVINNPHVCMQTYVYIYTYIYIYIYVHWFHDIFPMTSCRIILPNWWLDPCLQAPA